MPTKVAIIGHSVAESGAELFALRAASELMQRGNVRPTLYFPSEGPIVDRARAQHLPVCVVKAPSGMITFAAGTTPNIALLFNAASYAVKLSKVLSRDRPDIVWTNSAKAHVYGGIAALAARKPRVVFMHDILPNKSSAVRLITRGSVQVRSALIVANSVATLESATLNPRAQRRAIILYPPIGDEYFAKVPRTADKFERPARFLLVGRIAKWKGQDVAVEAMHVLRSQMRLEASLTLVGSALFDGDMSFEQELRSLISRRALDGCVHLAGFHQHPHALVNNFDYAIHCSTRAEPFGQVVAEAMAAGLPIIASSAGGPAEIIEDGVTGLLVPPDNPVALALAMKQLIESPSLAAQLSHAGHVAVAGNNAQSWAEQFESVLRSIL